MNVPKISLKSTIEKNKTEQSITTNININTGTKKEEEEIKAEYRNPNPNLPNLNPYDNLAAYDQVSVEGPELEELLKQMWK